MGDEKNNDAIEPSNNEIDKFPESEKKKKLIQDTSKDLIGSVNKTPRELANIAIQTLKETF